MHFPLHLELKSKKGSAFKMFSRHVSHSWNLYIVLAHKLLILPGNLNDQGKASWSVHHFEGKYKGSINQLYLEHVSFKWKLLKSTLFYKMQFRILLQCISLPNLGNEQAGWKWNYMVRELNRLILAQACSWYSQNYDKNRWDRPFGR